MCLGKRKPRGVHEARMLRGSTPEIMTLGITSQVFATLSLPSLLDPSPSERAETRVTKSHIAQTLRFHRREKCARYNYFSL